MATATKKKSKVTLQPLGDKVVVEREETEEKTAGGIFIPDAAKDKPSGGTIIAASELVPFSAAHASYFALLTKSNGLDGGSVFTSPSVDCLYKEYNCSNVSLLGLLESVLLSAAACSNCSFSSIRFFLQSMAIFFIGVKVGFCSNVIVQRELLPPQRTGEAELTRRKLCVNSRLSCSQR